MTKAVKYKGKRSIADVYGVASGAFDARITCGGKTVWTSPSTYSTFQAALAAVDREIAKGGAA